jgi:TonB family protein
MRISQFSRLTGTALLCLAAALPVGAMSPDRIPVNVALDLVVAKQAPETPLIARQHNLSGVVELDVTINEQGSVEKADVLRGNPILAKAAQDCIKKWKFKPYKQGDKAVAVITTLSFSFK